MIGFEEGRKDRICDLVLPKHKRFFLEIYENYYFTKYLSDGASFLRY